jgi:hypothetical protein
MNKKYYLLFISIIVTACQPTNPVIEKSTSNIISISYNAYGSTPTLTPEALDIAIEHCKKQKLFANYRGVTVPNPLGTKEVHTFACEQTKTDDTAVIIAQNEQYAAAAAAAVDAFAMGYNSAAATYTRPTYTTCNTFGLQTRCSSY